MKGRPMAWVEQELKERKQLSVTPAREKLLNEVKKGSLPTIAREAANGDKPVEAIRFQPVKSVGRFEAEFAKRGGDIIFHFWPWGLHAADREGTPRPPFTAAFRVALPAAFLDEFDKKLVSIEEDRDMGAFFVKAEGYGKKQFWFDLATKVVTNLHRRLGGD
jgi:hypothetical protein